MKKAPNENFDLSGQLMYVIDGLGQLHQQIKQNQKDIIPIDLAHTENELYRVEKYITGIRNRIIEAGKEN